jgi:hypothetical protein
MKNSKTINDLQKKLFTAEKELGFCSKTIDDLKKTSVENYMKNSKTIDDLKKTTVHYDQIIQGLRVSNDLLRVSNDLLNNNLNVSKINSLRFKWKVMKLEREMETVINREWGWQIRVEDYKTSLKRTVETLTVGKNCDICFETMNDSSKKPLMTCANGHYCCEACGLQLLQNRCHLCREDLLF